MDKEITYRIVKVSKNRKEADQIALVFDAKGIEYRFEPFSSGNGYIFSVHPIDVERAETELLNYEKEKEEKQKPSTPIPLYPVNKIWFGIVFLFLIIFHFYVRSGFAAPGLVTRGNAAAHLIVKGEIWRTVTALTLHSDIGHVGANVVFGAIVAWAVLRLIGTGTGWFLIILSGSLGNFFNAVFYRANHFSIGASTAVFGAVGILAALQFHKKFRLEGVRKWVPLGAGLALLGSLGAGKETDVLAHLFGFGAGAGIGFISGFILAPAEKPFFFKQFIFSCCALGMLAFSWLSAGFF